MKLNELIENLSVIKIIGDVDVDITDVKIDSKIVALGSLFVCLRGNDYDGHLFAKEAEKYGCTAIICEEELEIGITQIIVADTRKALSLIAGNFFGNVHKKMTLIGVVGTNGKTTTAHLIGEILNTNGVKCGVIGTLGAFYQGNMMESSLTTPDPLQLHKMLKDMYDCGVKTVVMEVSAHAIYHKKINGLDFALGVFTNFSRDHLDFFVTEENYKKAKLKFFEENNCKYIVANVDDDFGIELKNRYNNVITYSILNPSDVFAIEVSENKRGVSFVINLFDCIYKINMNINGEFNVYNAMASATATALLGVKTDKIISSLKKFKGVKGRMEKVYDEDFTVYIDYAHTPDGLEKVLSAINRNKKGRVICVFGCGGNRDVGKREKMGKISGALANFSVITSDNPRFEEPMDIIFEIEKGVLSVTKDYLLIQDREEAIEYALNLAKTGDVVLIAGKGGEKYQEILGIKRPYNDNDTVKEVLRRMGL